MRFVISVSLFLFYQIAFTQVVNLIDNKGTIKTVDSSKWILATNDIYNKNSGNVGIGVTLPTTKFHVQGTVRFQGLGTNLIDTDFITINSLGNVTSRAISSVITATTSTAITYTATTVNVNNTIANWNANQLQGNNIAIAAPIDRQLLTWDATTSTWKPDGYQVITITTTTYTLTASDHGKILDFTSNSPITLIVPITLTTGFQVSITQAGNGIITFSPGLGMAINNRWGGTKTAGQWAKSGIEIRATGSAILSGDVN